MIKEKWSENFYNNLFISYQTLFRNPFTLTLHCTSPLKISKVIGPGSKLVYSNGNKDSEDIILVIGRFDPTMGFSIYFDMNSNTDLESFYVQAIVDIPLINNNKRKIRVMTTKLPTTERFELTLHSLDEDVGFILLTKSIVIDSLNKNSEEIKDEIDHKLKDVCDQYRCSLERSKVHINDIIINLPLRIFEFRRGSLISSILQHNDDIYNMRILFLRLNYDNAFEMINPVLSQFFPENYNKSNAGSSNDVIEFHKVPLETLALHSKSILYFNMFSEIYIWIGSQLDKNSTKDIIEECMKSVLSFQYKYPYPNIYIFHEGSSMSRRLLCYLIPSHKDPPELQKTSFSYLKDMEENEYKQMIGKFLKTNDLSYREYLYKIFRK